jgi:hypothetical protein
MKYNKLYLVIGLGILGIVFIGFLATKILPSVFVTWTKAAPATKVSMANSYLIGGKILAKADGEEKCIVNVFVMDESGKGVKGVPVDLSGMDSGEMQSVSTVDGKATFEISSFKEGQYTLAAAISGSTLDKTVKVTFRN